MCSAGKEDQNGEQSGRIAQDTVKGSPALVLMFKKSTIITEVNQIPVYYVAVHTHTHTHI